MGIENIRFVKNRYLYFFKFEDILAGINFSRVGAKCYSHSVSMEKIEDGVIEKHSIFNALGLCNELFHPMQ